MDLSRRGFMKRVTALAAVPLIPKPKNKEVAEQVDSAIKENLVSLLEPKQRAFELPEHLVILKMENGAITIPEDGGFYFYIDALSEFRACLHTIHGGYDGDMICLCPYLDSRIHLLRKKGGNVYTSNHIPKSPILLLEKYKSCVLTKCGGKGWLVNTHNCDVEKPETPLIKFSHDCGGPRTDLRSIETKRLG